MLASLSASLQSYNPWDVGVRVLHLSGAADTGREPKRFPNFTNDYTGPGYPVTQAPHSWSPSLLDTCRKSGLGLILLSSAISHWMNPMCAFEVPRLVCFHIHKIKGMGDFGSPEPREDWPFLKT